MSLGVAHSPGHPIPSLLGHAASLLPFGDVAWRVNLASAACGAGAVWALYLAGRALCRRVAPGLSPRLHVALAMAAAVVFGLSWAAWFQSVRAEVYALQALLVIGAMGAVIAFDEGGERRWLLLAGLLAGLGLANHHLIAILFLLPAGACVFARRVRRPGVRAAAMTAAAGILGLAALAYLPVRSTQHPEVNWGAPHTAERFAWTVSAKAFQKAVREEHVSKPAEDTAQVIVALIKNATIPMVLLALLGMYLGLRRRGWRRLLLMLVGVAGTSAAARVVLGFEGDLPDHHAYLMPAIAAIILLGLAGAAAAAQIVADRSANHARTAGLVATALVVVCCILQLARSAEARSLSAAYASDEIARWELEDLPPRSVVLLSYFQTSFRVWALRAVDQSRPDLVLLDRSFLTYPGMAAEAKRRYPDMAALIDTPLRAGSPTPVAMLQRIAARRPVFVQLHPNLDVAAYSALVPRGAFSQLPPSAPTELTRRTAETRDARARTTLAARFATLQAGDAVGVLGTLLWHDFVRLQFYCALHRRRAARATLDAALALAPRDAMLEEVAAACGLGARGPR